MVPYVGFFVWFVFLHKVHSFAQNDDIALLIEDFVDFYKYSKRIYTQECWEKELQFHLPKIVLHAKYNALEFPSTKSQVVIFMDMSCKESDLFLQNMRKCNMLTPRLVLLLTNTTALTSHYFPLNSNVFFITHWAEGYSINKIYSISSSTTIGTWTRAQGYIERSIINKFQPTDHRKVNLKISYVISDQYEDLKYPQYQPINDATFSLNYVLLGDVIRMINATRMDSFKRGSKEYELVDDLAMGTFDIGGTPLALTSEKITKMDVLAKTFTSDSKFIFRAAPHSYISNVFTLPFDSYVWYCCFGLMVIIFLVVYVVVCWEWKDPVFKLNLQPNISLRPNPVDIFLMEVGSAAQQGFEAEPRSNSGRIVFMFTLISFMFLYTSFSASIVALLQSTTDSLNTFDHLFQSRINVGFKQNISMDFFSDLRYQPNHVDYYRKIKKPEFFTVEEGVKRLQSEFFAFYAETSEVYQYINRWFLESEKCSLREIPFKNTNVDYWLFMKKNSEYRDILRMGMNSIQERGVLSREFKRLFPLKPFCDSIGGNFESVGLVDSYGAFLVMVYGVGLSTLLFLLEHVSFHYNLGTKAESLRKGVSSIIHERDIFQLLEKQINYSSMNKETSV